ncbi:chromosome partitioning protein ParB [Listeria monocytogenes]|nr:chromosome partitioning protein ParB [Listeria monocytogenes]EAD0607569.1 chromosome partitioning protein ParB [Listeria monocytogenes]EAD2109645.1 chromosome partitioning protein ParB [Listeria monocytogenes]EAG2509272.1 chromosome partitioning protein ParB [Listeria monocytogenes]EAW7087531.1 chromosome partitioning protein ParB [Listeria monocytogenes]
MINLLEKAAANQLEQTGQVKKLTVPGWDSKSWVVYKIPLEYLYYNDKNGRINTVYKQYQAENGRLKPQPGNSDYNEIFEKFIYNSNSRALENTLQSIKEKTQQEPGVVLSDGRVIDGNRRFTALRMYQNQDYIPKTFEAVILSLDVNSENDEKKIKELELDLQLGREERVNYDPIDRIFDVYNTIEVEKLMMVEEYKKASGAGNTKGIKRDIRLAKLILQFIEIVSPGGNPVDKFYLARELKLDGPIEEIEGTINKLKDKEKTAITEAILTYLAVVKSTEGNTDVTRIMRDVKTKILKNDEIKKYFLRAVDDKVDDIIDAFSEIPIKNSNDLKQVTKSLPELNKSVNEFQSSVNRLIYKGKKDSERKEALLELQNILEKIEELDASDFKELTTDEFLDAKDVLMKITDTLFKLKQEMNK